MFNISPVDSQFNLRIAAQINNKTKPIGALGQLELLAKQLAAIYSSKQGSLVARISITQPNLAVFAGDHGIAGHGVSIAPSEVTQQMVMNFAQGGAAINVFTKQCGWQLSVIDAGILSPVPSTMGIIEQRLGAGTQPIHLADAMSIEQVLAGFEYAKGFVNARVAQGCNLIAFGEMGIGNTSSASAIMAVILAQSAEQTVGRGTGIDDAVLVKKIELVQSAVDRAKANRNGPHAKLTPVEILAALGGFEIVQICGAMLAAAEQQIAVVVDGFICTAAAMVAKLIAPNISDYLIFSHHSGEQGHGQMLAWFDAEPLLNLGLRLGEGTGAALCLPLIEAAANFYNDMASFDSAQVANVVDDQGAV